jgi:hypothetical protein
VIKQASSNERVLVIGTGAALLAPQRDTLVYADMARWEIQLRYRRNELGNLGLDNRTASFAEKYKCGFFAEWRAADRLKKRLMPALDFVLDTNNASQPKMIRGEVFRRALSRIAQRPFRVVPYFDPGPWGGHWMEEVCDLPKDLPNHAWCFDCVPEENSLLLGFGDTRSRDLCYRQISWKPHSLSRRIYRSFALSSGSVIWVYMSEIFPTRVRIRDRR